MLFFVGCDAMEGIFPRTLDAAALNFSSARGKGGEEHSTTISMR